MTGRARKPKKRLRLLKVVVQPIFILEDGDEISEQPTQPQEVSAAEWPDFAATGFDRAVAALRRQFEGPSGG